MAGANPWEFVLGQISGKPGRCRRRGYPPSLPSVPESLLGAKWAGTAGQAAALLASWRMLTVG